MLGSKDRCSLTQRCKRMEALPILPAGASVDCAFARCCRASVLPHPLEIAAIRVARPACTHHAGGQILKHLLQQQVGVTQQDQLYWGVRFHGADHLLQDRQSIMACSTHGHLARPRVTLYQQAQGSCTSSARVKCVVRFCWPDGSVCISRSSIFCCLNSERSRGAEYRAAENIDTAKYAFGSSRAPPAQRDAAAARCGPSGGCRP